MWSKKLPEQRELLAVSLNNDSSFKGFENPIDLFHIGTLRHGTSDNYNEYIIKSYSKLSKEKQESLLKFIDLHIIPLNSKAYDVINSIGESEESKDILQRLKTRVVLNHLVVPRVVFFGTTGLLAAVQYTGIGKILLTEGVAGAGAASLVGPIIAAISTTTLNVISVGGMQLSKTNDNTSKADIIRTTRVVAISLGVVFGGFFVSTKLILPSIIKDVAIARISGDFLATYAASVIPDLLLAVNGIIAFQNDKSWLMPPITAAIYRLSSVGLAYTLGKSFEAYGVGFGSSIAAWSSMLVSQLWFCQTKYTDIKLWNLLNTADIKVRMKEFGKKGLKLGLGGITEWGNLAAISFIIGSFTNQLSETQPSIETLVLVNSFFQGLSRASMFVASENKHMLDSAITGEMSRNFHKVNLIQLGVLTGSINEDDFIVKREINIEVLSKYQFYNSVNFTKLPEQFVLREFLESFNHPLGELVSLENAYHEDKIYIYKSIIAAIILNCMIAGIIYAARQIIVDYYSPADSDASNKNLAEKLLLINTIGIIPDGVRIVSGSILRGCGNLLMPNIVSLVVMSGIGIPVGAAIGLSIEESIIPIFIVRNVAIFVAASINCYQIWRQFQNEHRTKYQVARSKLMDMTVN